MAILSSTSPIIGITSYVAHDINSFCSPAAYSKAVQRAGGIPILLPPMQLDVSAILERVDGVILTGGGDIEPECYGGVAHPTIYGTDRDRDTAELNLAHHLLKLDKPILGICRGLEILNVACGGSLIAHIPDVFGETILHRVERLTPSSHLVDIFPDTCLGRILGESSVQVVSWHHQAVSHAPEGWRVCAKAPDGLIEALEHETHPWAIALQWHPEMSPHDPLQQRIFTAFIQAAQGNC